MSVVLFLKQKTVSYYTPNSVKPLNNDHPRDPKIVAVVDGWSLFRGQIFLRNPNGTKKGGHYRKVFVSSGFTNLNKIIAQVHKLFKHFQVRFDTYGRS